MMVTRKNLYLAADIGGTTSRFALFRDHGNDMQLIRAQRIPTDSADSFPKLLGLLREGPLGEELPQCRAAALAVPGAVRGGIYADPPNISWDIDTSSTPLTGLPDKLILINDFAAQALACKTTALEGGEVLNQGLGDDQGVVGVIGAGTGLGHGILATLPGGRYLALPSEAGHAAFAFVNQEEREFERFVLQEQGLNYVCGDLVVSGRGLSLLHQFHFGERLKPAETAAAMDDASPVQAWFARFYGRACRHFALNILATGGMVIAGGVAAKNPGLVKHPQFLLEFVNSLSYGRLLRDIPVILNSNEDSGLWGAALAAKLASR